MNPRPHAPKARALPSCATLRKLFSSTRCIIQDIRARVNRFFAFFCTFFVFSFSPSASFSAVIKVRSLFLFFFDSFLTLPALSVILSYRVKSMKNMIGGIHLPSGKHVLGMKKARHIFGTAKVGERGQIVIPKDARELYGIHPGDTLLILGDEENGMIVTKPDVLSSLAERILDQIGKEGAYP